MISFECGTPTRVIFGVDRIEDLGTHTKNLGRRVFLFSDPFNVRNGVTERATESLQAEGMNVIVYDDIKSNPLSTSVDRAAEMIVAEQCDVIISLGGGSTMDTAKAANVVASNGGKIWEYVVGGTKKPTVINYPIIAITTTSGTGSHMTPSAVISNPDLGGQKRGLSDRRCYAQVAIVDPELMLSMPPKLTASVGMDVLAHCIEAIMNTRLLHPYSELLALASIRIAARALPKAFAHGNDIEARSQMAWADTLAGWVLTHTDTGLAHTLGMAEASLYDSPHGASVVACLPKIMEMSIEAIPDRLAKIAESLDETTRNLPVVEKAAKSVTLFRRLLKEIDLEISYGDLGVGDKDVDKIVDTAYSCWAKQVENNNARRFSRDEICGVVASCL